MRKSKAPAQVDGGLLVKNHERCTCGHCRCEHQHGFGPCTVEHSQACDRYTWPGPGATLPADHAK